MSVYCYHLETMDLVFALTDIDLLDRKLCQFVQPTVASLLFGKEAEFDHLGEVGVALGTVFVNEADPFAYVLAIDHETGGDRLVFAPAKRIYHCRQCRHVTDDTDVRWHNGCFKIRRNGSVHFCSPYRVWRNCLVLNLYIISYYDHCVK